MEEWAIKSFAPLPREQTSSWIILLLPPETIYIMDLCNSMPLSTQIFTPIKLCSVPHAGCIFHQKTIILQALLGLHCSGREGNHISRNELPMFHYYESGSERDRRLAPRGIFHSSGHSAVDLSRWACKYINNAGSGRASCQRQAIERFQRQI